MDGGHDLRALADGRGDALDGASAYVADGEEARHGGLHRLASILTGAHETLPGSVRDDHLPHAARGGLAHFRSARQKHHDAERLLVLLGRA